MTVAPSMLAGAATVDLTPAGSVFLFGYPHAARMSTGVHDPLTCTALFLRSGEGQAMFLANDLAFVSRAFVAGVRRRIQVACGVPEHAILISTTHTHSGPVTVDQLSNAGDGVVPPADHSYLARIAEQMVAAACAAVRAAEPAELALVTARADGVGTNRHDPAGPADPEVPVLLARSRATQQLIACLLVCAMHPTVLHEDSTLISGDFPHFTRQWLRAHVLPPSCPVLFHQGASGNQSPRHTARANTFAEAQRLGELLGRAVAAAMTAPAFRAAGPIRVAQRFVSPEPRVFPPAAAAERDVAAARDRFAELQRAGAPRQVVRTAECNLFGAEETAALARAAANGRLDSIVAACLPAEVQLVQVGPWNIVGWPGEFFVEYALEVKARVPGTILITFANGELQGYIATEAADRLGYYEARNAVFAASNGRRFVEATLALLQLEGGQAA